jgi:hypothetical protein
VFIAHVTCSDQDCAEEFEAVVETLEEIDDVVCKCGSGTVLVSVAEADTSAPVIELRFDRPRRLAA